MADSIMGQNYGQPPTPVQPTTAVINCQLQVALNPENVVVYVCRGTKQCFNFTAISCCGQGDIKIEFNGPMACNNRGEIVVQNFGTFTLNVSGICFKPDENLGKDGYGTDDKWGRDECPTEVTLNFKASSCGVDSPFEVHFVFDPCKCCCKCRKSK